MAVLFCEKLPQLVVGNIFFIWEMKDPVMIIQAKIFTSSISIQLCMSLQPYYKVSFIYVKTYLYFCFFVVNSRCYAT